MSEECYRQKVVNARKLRTDYLNDKGVEKISYDFWTLYLTNVFLALMIVLFIVGIVDSFNWQFYNGSIYAFGLACLFLSPIIATFSILKRVRQERLYNEALKSFVEEHPEEQAAIKLEEDFRAEPDLRINLQTGWVTLAVFLFLRCDRITLVLFFKRRNS